jgi:hypothetical protein
MGFLSLNKIILSLPYDIFGGIFNLFLIKSMDQDQDLRPISGVAIE